jgi:hypothetical protein
MNDNCKTPSTCAFNGCNCPPGEPFRKDCWDAGECLRVRLPAWQDVLGDAEQLVKQKPTFSKYIKGTVLENDVPVWIADFAQRLLLRELTRIQTIIATDRCDGETEYAAGANAARAKYLAAINKR